MEDRLARRQAAQPVVAAELDDGGVRPLRQRPVEPRQPSRGGVAGHARVQHPHVVAAPLERRFEPGHEALAGGQAVTGGEAVAEGEEADRAGGRGLRAGRRDGEGGQRREENRAPPIVCRDRDMTCAG
jgi:hypothetical protein